MPGAGVTFPSTREGQCPLSRRHRGAPTQAGRSCELLSDDDYSAGPPLLGVSHFTTFQKTKPHSPTTIWCLQTNMHEILACVVLAATKTNIPLCRCLKAKRGWYYGNVNHGHIHSVENQDRSKYGSRGSAFPVYSPYEDVTQEVLQAP